MTCTIRRLAIVGVAVLGAAVPATGCSTPPEPGAAPTAPTTSSSPAVSPSPSAPAEAVLVEPGPPAEMDEDGPQGAEAAARYFLELDSYVQTTGDTARWDAMSHASCEYCANRAQQAQQIAANHDRYEGGKVTAALDHTYAQDPSTGIWPMDLTVTESASSITSSAGRVLFENGASNYQVRVEAALSEGSWVIVTVADRPQP